MVRFKLFKGNMTIGESKMFQFHDGSIQAGARCPSGLRADLVSIPRWFDSSSVAPGAGETDIGSFNSTMVRFKPDTQVQFNDSSALFQFHDGSIQAIESLFSDERPGVVSIPRWFDSSQTDTTYPTSGDASFNSTMVRFKQPVC